MTDGALPRIRLTAYRPDWQRYERLTRMLRSVQAAVEVKGDYQKWMGALLALDDAKGDFTAAWRSQADLDAFGPLLDDAWMAEDDPEHEPINHRIGLADLDRMITGNFD